MKSMKQLLVLMGLVLSFLPVSAQKYAGGDISLLPSYESHGAVYLDASGNRISSLLPYLKHQGLNAMRVRVFADPANATQEEKGQGVVQTLDYAIALARQIKQQGLALIVDFHYSDTWADPSKQWTPQAWVSLTDAALRDTLSAYTLRALQAFNAAGATPDFIQTGNEISYGLCWGARDTQEAKKAYATTGANWQRFTSLLSAAVAACRQACPKAKVIIHTERVADPTYLVNYYKGLQTAGIGYDIAGLSYYSYYHGNLQQLSRALTALERAVSKDIMLVETGYYHDYQPSGITGSYDLSNLYPVTSDGQKAFTEALVDTLQHHPRVKGLFWWFLEANEHGLDWATQRVTDGWYNAGLFDNATGRVEPALTSLARFADSSTGIALPKAGGSDSEHWYTLGGRAVSRPSGHGIFVSSKGRKRMP